MSRRGSHKHHGHLAVGGSGTKVGGTSAALGSAMILCTVYQMKPANSSENKFPSEIFEEQVAHGKN